MAFLTFFLFEIVYICKKKQMIALQTKLELVKVANGNGLTYGIENLKRIYIWKGKLISQIANTIEKQKRINMWALFWEYGDDLQRLVKIFQYLEEAGKEFEDLNQSEINELQTVFNAEIQSVSPKYRFLIEKIDRLITINASGIYSIIKELNNV